MSHARAEAEPQHQRKTPRNLARRLLAAARLIEVHSPCEPCREAAREIALMAIEMQAQARNQE